jgi:hypothetical protein
VQSTPFSKLKMIPQKLDHFYKPFGHNKSGGLWLSATVLLVGAAQPPITYSSYSECSRKRQTSLVSSMSVSTETERTRRLLMAFVSADLEFIKARKWGSTVFTTSRF